jgi:CubicO group peptidase (beta-lactamase class C family)
MLQEEIDALAERTRFSGVVRADRGDEVLLARAYGLADRAHAIPNTVDTRLGVASIGKGFTALTVVRLIADGVLALDTTARSILGADLPSIDDRVTIEHLLGHRSGIGDYLDEEDGHAVTDHVLPVSAHELEGIEDFVKVLDGHPQVAPPGERFTYCNGGFVVLALLAERAAGEPYHDLVMRLVCEPAGLTATGFPRSDELPGDVAMGYLDVDAPRTNIFHLPVRGTGDGGIVSTVADLRALWPAFLDGRIVPHPWPQEMLRPRSTSSDGKVRYGLGFWLHATRDVAWLTGHDAGVSCASTHDPSSGIVHTVISNTSEGAWPVVERLDELLGTA